MDETIPPKVTEEEIWLANNVVIGVQVEYRQTGTDTAETYIHLRSSNGDKRVWLDRTFNRYCKLKLDYYRIVEPVEGLRAKVKARLDWEKANDYELNLYKQLKEKYG